MPEVYVFGYQDPGFLGFCVQGSGFVDAGLKFEIPMVARVVQNSGLEI